MSEHTPIEVPLIDRDKAELVRIVGRLKEELTWYVGERNRLIAEAPVAPSRSAAPEQVPCEGCGGTGRREISIEMALDAGDRSMAGGSVPCTNCGGDGFNVEASAAPPSEREAAERIANKIVYSTANRELSPEQFKTFIAGIILHEFAAARAAVPQAAADGDDEATEARWQKRIYDLCREAVGPELAHTIDGSGCDSGDALDVTLLEIRQAIGLVRGAAAVPAPATEWENRYRQLLWESHAGYTHRSYLYGDDGEMQCNHHDCLLDFKRAAIEEIDKHLWEMNLKRAAKQQAVAGATAPPKEGK